MILLFALLLQDPLPADDGYRGIWYMNQPSKDEYKYKYSGGYATYPQQHIPIAIYSKEADKTFFVYGGTVKGKQELLHMVSYYDHATGTVPRPRILLNKKTDDAHDNPTLQIDDAGHLWIFSNAHGHHAAGLPAPQREALLDRRLREDPRHQLQLQPALVPDRPGLPVPPHAI